MPLNDLSNKILYVPFTQEYEVPIEFRKSLGIDDFFESCFVSPNFEQKIEEIKTSSPIEIEQSEYPIERADMINALEEEIKERNSFYNWLNNNGEGIYCFLGDAGTGKTTYLHYLKWFYKDIAWQIFDIQKANKKVLVNQHSITFNNFSSLHSKATSTIFIGIITKLFVKKANNEYDLHACCKNIKVLLSNYKSEIIKYGIEEKYQILYNRLSAIKNWIPTTNGKKRFLNKITKIVVDYFTENCSQFTNENESLESFECALTHFAIVSRCLSHSNKTMIVFDNLERFIGVDEIFNDELIQFISNLRAIGDTYGGRFKDSNHNINLFAQQYQFIVSMRNTSVRNFTPQQNADFFEHSIDLSDWFSISEIIEAKVKWYNSHNIKVGKNDELNQIAYIINDFGLTSTDIVRGLRPKLNLIFNFNKRLIVDYLVGIFQHDNNILAIQAANKYRVLDSEGYIIRSRALARFAYRSIIWRLIMDKLRTGGLFSNIFSNNSNKEQYLVEMEYVRKVLTILSNYSLAFGKSYMPFNELIELFFDRRDELISSWYYDDTFKTKRKMIARVLYFMNYYNRRDNHWFQFIDIQYNVAAYDGKRLITYDDLFKLVESAKESPENINIRITNAGKAYLGYMVHTFEFVSCMDKCSEPLLMFLPTETELLNNDLMTLPCVEVIKNTSLSIATYIKTSKSDVSNTALSYKKGDGNRRGDYYPKRLLNSSNGYIDNFCECIDELIPSDERKTEDKKNRLKYIIRSFRNRDDLLDK